MAKKLIAGLLAVVVILGVGVFYLYNKQSKKEKKENKVEETENKEENKTYDNDEDDILTIADINKEYSTENLELPETATINYQKHSKKSENKNFYHYLVTNVDEFNYNQYNGKKDPALEEKINNYLEKYQINTEYKVDFSGEYFYKIITKDDKILYLIYRSENNILYILQVPS